MLELLRYVLPLCTIFVFGYIFIFRSHLISRKINTPTMVLPKDGSLECLLGRYFKFTHYGLLIFCLTFSLYPDIQFYLGLFNFLNKISLQIIGLISLFTSCSWMILAQVKMSNSWRMGVDKKKKTELITGGLFTISRNPFFLGLLIFFTSIFLLSPNILTLFLFTTQFILISIQIRIEEHHLAHIHNEKYINYQKRVKRYLGKQKN
jgi:protein-S-isoprenylcysteine O-methyltransferase Ste14